MLTRPPISGVFGVGNGALEVGSDIKFQNLAQPHSRVAKYPLIPPREVGFLQAAAGGYRSPAALGDSSKTGEHQKLQTGTLKCVV